MSGLFAFFMMRSLNVYRITVVSFFFSSYKSPIIGLLILLLMHILRSSSIRFSYGFSKMLVFYSSQARSFACCMWPSCRSTVKLGRVSFLNIYSPWMRRFGITSYNCWSTFIACLIKMSSMDRSPFSFLLNRSSSPIPYGIINSISLRSISDFSFSGSVFPRYTKSNVILRIILLTASPTL